MALGMLDVLHCVLIDSPEALNMMKEEHIKVIISLLEKHGRDKKVKIQSAFVFMLTVFVPGFKVPSFLKVFFTDAIYMPSTTITVFVKSQANGKNAHLDLLGELLSKDGSRTDGSRHLRGASDGLGEIFLF